MNPQQQDNPQSPQQSTQQSTQGPQPAHPQSPQPQPSQPQVILPGDNNAVAQDPAMEQQAQQPTPTPQPQVETPQAGEQINPQQPQPAIAQAPQTPAATTAITPQPGVATQPAPQNLEPQPTPEIIHQSNLVWIGKTNFNVKPARLTWYKDGDVGLQVLDPTSNQPMESVFKLNPKQITKIKAPFWVPGALNLYVDNTKYSLNFILSGTVRVFATVIFGIFFKPIAPLLDGNVKEAKWWIENLKTQMNSKS